MIKYLAHEIFCGMVFGMDMEETLKQLVAAKHKYGREIFCGWLKKAGVGEATFWRWEKLYGKVRKGKINAGTPNYGCVKTLSLVVAEEIAKLPVLSWHDGSPAWLIDDELPHSERVKSEYAEIGTVDDEIITVVVSWIEEPATRNEPSYTRNEGWGIFISHEQLDSGEGDRWAATLALYKILKEQKIKIEE